MTNIKKTKPAPNSKESEMMVLGCMLTSINALNIAADILNDSDFYCTEHKIIFSVLKAAYMDDKLADVHLISEELKEQDKLTSVGGVAYITTLAQYAGTSAYIEEYVKIVQDKAILRQMISIAQKIEREAYGEQLNVSDSINDALLAFDKISKKYISHNKNEISQIGEVISGIKSQTGILPFLNKVQDRYEFYEKNNKPFIAGIQTGFIDLDSKAIILEDTNLLIIAARPAMGKTALAMNISAHTCFEKNIPVGIISLEMNRDQLLERFISMQTEISGEKIKRGILTNEEYRKIVEETKKISEKMLFIIDRECSTIAQVASISRHLKEYCNIGLLVVDYLQLLGNGGSSDGRQYEVAEISRGLKLLAMELKIPIICISQLSRKVEERPDKRPLLSDLRDSGQIEQDADAVLFIYRHEYYDKSTKPNQAELTLKKNRHGNSDFKTDLYFNKDCGKFSNLASINDLNRGVSFG